MKPQLKKSLYFRSMATKEEILAKTVVLEKETAQHHIVIHNDDVNTFDFVIDALINICDHTQEQATQCTYLIHFKGKCTVKTGKFKELELKCSKLLQLGLSAELT